MKEYRVVFSMDILIMAVGAGMDEVDRLQLFSYRLPTNPSEHAGFRYHVNCGAKDISMAE